jgi:putative FmdB family regulatory protein
MPTYEYKCPTHGKFTELRMMSARHDDAKCKKCGTVSPYTISAPRVFGDFVPYESPASGRWIEGKRQRIEDMARTGTRPYEEGEMQDQARRAADAEKEADHEVDVAVDQTIGELRSN